MPGRIPSARYPLGEVRTLAATGQWFIGKTVIERTFKDYPEEKRRVTRFILSVVESLTESSFVATKTLAYDPGPVEADVYGVENAEGPWYVKFYIAGPRLIVVSCHSPAHDLTLANGLIIRRGYP